MVKLHHHWTQYHEVIIVCSIFILALGLRLYQLNFGLPQLYLEDEEFFVQPALRVASGNWNPNWFGAPAQTLIYLLAGLFRIVNFFINSSSSQPLAAWQNYQLQPSLFQLIGRLVPALAGALMAIVGYGIARFWSKRAAIYAGLIIASSFYLVLHSHIIRPDILQTLFLLGVIYSWLHILQHPTLARWYNVLGISLGLAINTKYPALFILPGLMSVIIMLYVRQQLKLRWWCQVGVISLLTSFVTGPFLYLSFTRILRDVRIENRLTHGGHDGFGFLQNLWWYVSHVLQFEIGTWLYAISIITALGLIMTMLRKQHELRHWQFCTIVVAGLGYLLCLSSLHLHWERWIIPVTVLAMILAAVGLDSIQKKLQPHSFIWIMFCLIIFLAPTLRLIRIIHALGQPYTIELARSWMLQHLPTGTKLVAEPYAPALPPDQYTVTTVSNLAVAELTDYQAQSIQYAVITEKVHGTMKIIAHTPTSPEYVGSTLAMQRYKAILKNSDLVYQISSHPQFTAEQLLYSHDIDALRTWRYDILLGPYVRVYRLP